MKYCSFQRSLTEFEISRSLFRASAQSHWLVTTSCIYPCIQHCLKGPPNTKTGSDSSTPSWISLVSSLIAPHPCRALQTYHNPHNTHCSARLWVLISVITFCRAEPAGEPTEKKTLGANSSRKWNKRIQASTSPNSSVGMSSIASVFGSCWSLGVWLLVTSGHLNVSKQAWLL